MDLSGASDLAALMLVLGGLTFACAWKALKQVRRVLDDYDTRLQSRPADSGPASYLGLILYFQGCLVFGALMYFFPALQRLIGH